MKQRDPLTATLLSIFVPFYIIYWFYVTANYMATKGVKVPSVLLLVAPAIILALLVPIMLLGTATGGNEALLAVPVMVFLWPISLAFSLVYFYKFSTVVEEITGHSLSKALLFVLFWFVAPAGVFLTQDKLNSVSPAAGTLPQSAPSNTTGASNGPGINQ